MLRKDKAAAYELGARLRQLREAAGLSGRELGRRCGMSQSKISRIEGGSGPVSKADLLAFLGCVPGANEARDSLLELARKSGHGTASPIGHIDLMKEPELFGDLERRATLLRTCTADCIPALLQTEQYAGAIIRTLPSWNDEISYTRALVARLQRQALLADQSREFRYLIGEGSLRNRFTTVEDHVAQLGALLNAAERPNVSVRCMSSHNRLPFAVFVSNYTVLDESLVLFDEPDAIKIEESPVVVSTFGGQFDALWDVATGGEDFSQLVRRVIDSVVDVVDVRQRASRSAS